MFKNPSSVPSIKSKYPHNISLRTVVINTDTRSVANLDQPISLTTIPARQVENVNTSSTMYYPVDAENVTRIIDRLALKLEMKLTRGRAAASQAFFERIGRFQFCVDGDISKDMDIGDYMYL